MLLPYVRTVKTINCSKYTYVQDNSYISKLKPSYNKIYQSLRIGNITSRIRYDTINKYRLQNDPEIVKGFQTAVCIIYISNAHEIETGGFTNEEKKKHSKNQSSSVGLVKEEYEILMDMDSDYFIYGKTK